MSKDQISIIMGVYNASGTIDEAIESIINQTYENWEFVICDDCSTDNTYDKLLNYEEKYPNKFKILKNKKNSKLAYSLNRCLEVSTGKYIARMDADDISDERRLEKQVIYLEENPEVDLVGTAIQRFNEKGLIDILVKPERPDRYSLRDTVPFHHPTIMTYKSVYDQLEGYTVLERTKRSQDYDLWFKFYKAEFIGENLSEPLLFFREDRQAIRRRTFKVRYNAFKTAIHGYKMLNYPLRWYVFPTARFLVKSSIPYFLVDIYIKFKKR